jgi:diguanylate cyclase (GGDEF)-like protein
MGAFSSRNEGLKQVQLVIQLRWITLAFVSLGALLYYLLDSYPIGALLIILLLFSLTNSLAEFHSRNLSRQKHPAEPGTVRRTLNVLLAVDILGVALAIYLTGGAGSALAAFYIVLIPAGGLLLSRSDILLHSVLALAALAAVFLLVAAGLGPAAELNVPDLVVIPNSQDKLLLIWVIQAGFIGMGAIVTSGIREQLLQSHRQERNARQQAETLRKSASALSSTLEMSQLLDLGLKHLRELVPCDGASICCLEDGVVRQAASWGAADPLYPFEVGKQLLDNEVLRSASSRRKAVMDWNFVEDIGTGRLGLHSRVLLPLVGKDEVRGFMMVYGAQRPMFEDQEVASLQALAGHVALAVENARLYERTRKMALTDGLTGLYNRSSFFNNLEREITRSQRYGRNLSLLMCDLDRFKAYNDQYGHLAGDELLRSLARVLTSVVRKSDIAFRYGGEEFILLLPETNLAAALELAERLRRKVENHPFMLVKNSLATYITISIGAASFPDHAEEGEALVDAADKALFLAKRSRNTVSSLPVPNLMRD